MKRSASDLAKMRRAGRVVAEMHERIRGAVRPGVTTAQLDAVGRDVIDRRGARSNFLGYHGFPAVICASPNDVIVHGIPGPHVLHEGDIVSIDCGAIVDGWHGDAAFTMGVGAIDADASRLIDVTERSLQAGIAAMRPGGRLSDIGAAVQRVAETGGFSVVREYTGHGIGLAMHEEPDVPNWGRPGRGRKLGPGHTYAVEPMVCAGRADTRLLDDGWTVVTADGSWAAHAEHTIAITEHGPEILTLA
ncbi:MAG: type I methionyl aminopeptidase [Acidimicrobiales bacterium]